MLLIAVLRAQVMVAVVVIDSLRLLLGGRDVVDVALSGRNRVDRCWLFVDFGAGLSPSFLGSSLGYLILRYLRRCINLSIVILQQLFAI